jgi:hypothetical protein
VFHSHLVALLIQETGKNKKKMMARAPGRPIRAVSVIQGRTHGRGKKRLSWMLILTLNRKQDFSFANYNYRFSNQGTVKAYRNLRALEGILFV